MAFPFNSSCDQALAIFSASIAAGLLVKHYPLKSFYVFRQKKAGFNYLVEGESYGLPVFDIESGNHLVKAEFKNTPVRNLADTVSIASVVLWGVMLCKLLIRK